MIKETREENIKIKKRNTQKDKNSYKKVLH